MEIMVGVGRRRWGFFFAVEVTMGWNARIGTIKKISVIYISLNGLGYEYISRFEVISQAFCYMQSYMQEKQ